MSTEFPEEKKDGENQRAPATGGGERPDGGTANEPIHPAQTRSTAFGKISILMLSIEWVVFGSMHFSLRTQTIQMIPAFIPFRNAIVTLTGMIEVAAGILILVGPTRRLAAFTSLFLLAIYLPIVYYILSTDDSISGTGIIQTSFRVLMLPNNIFLAICATYLVQTPSASLRISSAPRYRAPRFRVGEYSGLPILLTAGLLLMANCAGFVAILNGMRNQAATAALWAMMCIAVGALIGFLFAVPRVNPDVRSGSLLVTNTNIEQVSDWLTKILVGVGLVNFKDIGQFVGDLSKDLAPALGTEAAPVTQNFALSLVIYFFVVGIIQGYLLTRLFLSKQFALEAQVLEANRRALPRGTSGAGAVRVADPGSSSAKSAGP